jgi:hypothetical protein
MPVNNKNRHSVVNYKNYDRTIDEAEYPHNFQKRNTQCRESDFLSLSTFLESDISWDALQVRYGGTTELHP